MKSERKALISMILACSMIAGCASTPDPMESTDPVAITQEQTVPTEDPTVLMHEQLTAQGYIPIEQLLQGSDIRVTVDGATIILSEDGLELELSCETPWIWRDGFIMAALGNPPEIVGDTAYVFQRDFEQLFQGEHSELSLFYGISFYPEEIASAVMSPDGSEFNQKLLAEVLLPTSMGIETPHVDMGRVFKDIPLSLYTNYVSEDLKELGYENPEEITYSEYQVIYRQKKTSEYEARKNREWQEFLDGLTEEQMQYAEEKGIELRDFAFLKAVFMDDLLNQSDEVLKTTLELYYSAGYRQGGRELTSDEIGRVIEVLDAQCSEWVDFNGIASCFVIDYFPSPAHLDLSAFINYAWYSMDEFGSIVPDEEYQLLREQKGLPWEKQDDMPSILLKFNNDYLDSLFQEYLGCSLNDLEDAGKDLWNTEYGYLKQPYYLEEYDAYYANKPSEGVYGLFHCVGGFVYDGYGFFQDGYAVLYSYEQYYDIFEMLILVERDGKYYFQSYLPLY